MLEKEAWVIPINCEAHWTVMASLFIYFFSVFFIAGHACMGTAHFDALLLGRNGTFEARLLDIMALLTLHCYDVTALLTLRCHSSYCYKGLEYDRDQVC